MEVVWKLFKDTQIDPTKFELGPDGQFHPIGDMFKYLTRKGGMVRRGVGKYSSTSDPNRAKLGGGSRCSQGNGTRQDGE